MSVSPISNDLEWFAAGGEMAGRIRRCDWSCTPLGPIERWSETLQSLTRALLASRQPATLWWGDACTTLYNDAARRVLGDEHPKALGASARSVWRQHWKALNDDVGVRRRIVVEHEGVETHYSVSRMEIPDAHGTICGVLCELVDDTPFVVSQHRAAMLRDIEQRNAQQTGWLEVCEQALGAIESNPCGISFAAIYMLDPLRSRLSLAGAVGLPAAQSIAPSALAFDGSELWPTGDVLRNAQARELAPLPPALVKIAGLRDRRTGSVFLLPIVPVKNEAAGVVIVGMDSTFPVDREARAFLDQLCNVVTAGVARSQLGHSRFVFEAMATSAPAAIFAKDLEGRYAYVNRLAREMLGHRHVIGRTDEELLPPPVAARLREQDAQVIATKRSVQREERLGSRMSLLIKFPWTDPRGVVAGVYGVAIDTSERRRIEETLQRSEQLYRAIGESIDYGVWVCDASGRNIYASESFLRLTGITQQQCSDFGWSSVLHPDDVDATLAAWNECVRTGALWDREHRVRGVDGNYHNILARGVPVRDAEGRIQRWVGLNLDITNLKEAEEKIRDSDRRKDEFVAMLAHELRNPLASIRNGVQILRIAGTDSTQQRQALDVISRQVTTLVRLVEDLLDIGRITHGKLALQMELVDLGSILRD